MLFNKRSDNWKSVKNKQVEKYILRIPLKMFYQTNSTLVHLQLY